MGENKKRAIRIVESKNKGRNNIRITVKREDVADALGRKDISSKEARERLVAAVIVNAEEEKQNKSETKKFRAKYLIPIVIPLVLTGVLMRACTKELTQHELDNISETTQTQQIQDEEGFEQDTESFEIVLYDIPNPYVEAWEMVRSKRTRRNDSKLIRRRYF